MDDRDVVAAIVAGDPAGPADAYDEHAESLYGYCHWMLGDPEDAADAVQDTFVIAAERLGGLRDPRKLRPWLYAVARNECHDRLGPAEAGPGEEAGPADPAGGRAELRRLVRAALDGLSPGEREIAELSLRHDLNGADLAAVLGVPRNRANALAARARGRLEKALGALLVARTGRRACPELDMLLGDEEGPLTSLSRRRVSHHIRRCGTCADRRHSALRPGVLYGMAPLAALPRRLRQEVLGLIADTGPLARSYRQDVTERVGPFGPNGFPQAIRPPWRRMFARSGVAAAAGIAVAIAATGIVAVVALAGSHPPPSVGAARSGRTPGTASAASTGSAGGASPSPPAATSGPTAAAAPPTAAPVAAVTKTAKPSRPATSSAAASPTPVPLQSRPTLTPPPVVVTPTSTAPATPTGTSTLPPG